MLLCLLIFFPMLSAALLLGIGRKLPRLRTILALICGLIELCTAIFSFFSPDAFFILPLMTGLSLKLDGFRKIYVLIIAFMWAMTLLLSPQYFRHHKNLNRYYFFTLMTLGATAGVFLSADLFTALVFFEIMSFTSFIWVIQEETTQAIRAAVTYLAVAVIGGLAALMGLFLLQHELGTTAIDSLYELAKNCPHRARLYAAGICILLGFGAKAGMFPLHIWLPKAHPVAPAPASALLSGVLTKSGVFGLIVLSAQLFRADILWGTLILILGTITMVLGAVLAVFSINLKRTLACSSMSQIGFILIGLGMMGLLGEENALAARGAFLHMVNHSLFKLVLFECAGVVFMNLHELDLNIIRGFGKKKPLLRAAFLLGALGISGVPLLNGYISKTLLHEAIVEGAALYSTGWVHFSLKLLEGIFLFSGGMTAAYMTKLYICLFMETNPTRQEEYDRMNRYLTPLSTAALALPMLLLPILGLSADSSMNGLADLSRTFFSASLPEEKVFYLSLENLKGAAISIGIGALLYLFVIRRWLMKNGQYMDRWPQNLDLEDRVYRPLLQKILPDLLGSFSAWFGENRLTRPLAGGIFAFGSHLAAFFHAPVDASSPDAGRFWSGTLHAGSILSRLFSDLPDALVLLLARTVYRPKADPNEDSVTSSLSYRLGRDVDRIAIAHGKEYPGGKRYAHLLYRTVHTLRETSRKITGNLSFALLMLCAAICLIFLYMLVLHLPH